MKKLLVLLMVLVIAGCSEDPMQVEEEMTYKLVVDGDVTEMTRDAFVSTMYYMMLAYEAGDTDFEEVKYRRTTMQYSYRYLCEDGVWIDCDHRYGEVFDSTNEHHITCLPSNHPRNK